MRRQGDVHRLGGAGVVGGVGAASAVQPVPAGAAPECVVAGVTGVGVVVARAAEVLDAVQGVARCVTAAGGACEGDAHRL